MRVTHVYWSDSDEKEKPHVRHENDDGFCNSKKPNNGTRWLRAPVIHPSHTRVCVCHRCWDVYQIGTIEYLFYSWLGAGESVCDRLCQTASLTFDFTPFDMHHRIYIPLPKHSTYKYNAKFSCSLNCSAVRDENAIAWLELSRFSSSSSSSSPTSNTIRTYTHTANERTVQRPKLRRNFVYQSQIVLPIHTFTIHSSRLDSKRTQRFIFGYAIDVHEFRRLTESLNLTHHVSN